MILHHCDVITAVPHFSLYFTLFYFALLYFILLYRNSHFNVSLRCLLKKNVWVGEWQPSLDRGDVGAIIETPGDASAQNIVGVTFN